MADHSAIGWTHATWNPWRGCTKVSEGCDNCYMFDGQERYGRDPEIVVRASEPTFLAPTRNKWLEQARAIQDKEQRRMRVFTCSWSDFFHPAADEWRDEAWDVIRYFPEYDWQILTKRPRLVSTRLPSDWGEGWPHVWLGVSIESRDWVYRADLLRETPAAVRFISAEPLLGPLVYDATEKRRAPVSEEPYNARVARWRDGGQGSQLDLTDIDWVITGGESGPKHRPLNLNWVRALRDACQMEEVAFFHKQNGGPKPTSGGRELDGRTWDEFPQTKEPVR
jgi:protein gp37